MEHPHQQRIVPYILMLLNVYSCRKGGMLKGSNISITEDMSRWFFNGKIAFFHKQLFSDEFERLGRNWESLSASQKRLVDTVLENIAKTSNRPIKTVSDQPGKPSCVLPSAVWQGICQQKVKLLPWTKNNNYCFHKRCHNLQSGMSNVC